VHLVSIDPGYRACGVAIFFDGRLAHAALVQSSVRLDTEGEQFVEMGRAVADYVLTHLAQVGFDVAIEYPQQYTSSPAPREPVQKLVGVIGSILAQLQARTGGLNIRSSTYRPREWKGQVPKDVMGRRILGRLIEEEAQSIPTLRKAALHNVIDAVGVGLHHLGRMKRIRVNSSKPADGDSTVGGSLTHRRRVHQA